MKRSAHIDLSTVCLDNKRAIRTKSGYLKVPATVTRTGVLKYRMPDGTIERRLRHPEDVFDPESLATLAGVPCTEDHPAYKGGPILLDAATTKDWQIGFTGDDVKQADNSRVNVPLTITDQGSIAAIDRGDLYEVSCGYYADREEVPGVFEGEPYDVRQRNIVYNHVAIVRGGTARAGRDMRLHLDSEAAIEVLDSANENQGEETMEKIKLGGKEIEVTAEAKEVIQAHLDSVDATNRSALADAKVAADKAQATVDGLQSDLDKAKAQLKTSLDSVKPENIQKLVRARKRIEGVATRVLPSDELKNLDSMSDQEVKSAVIKAERPKVDLSDKSEGYIDASFDSIEENLGDEKKADDLGERIAGSRKDDSSNLDSVSAFKKQEAEMASAWERKEA